MDEMVHVMEESIFDELESVDYAARTLVCSVSSHFWNMVRKTPQMDSLRISLHDRENWDRVFLRIIHCCGTGGSPGHTHPLDTAMAVYLDALMEVDLSLARRAAEIVLRTEGCFWSRGKAMGIVEKVGLESA